MGYVPVAVLFKAHHPNIVTVLTCSLSALPEKPDPINWDYYRQRISQPGLVDNFQKQFEAVSVPYPKDNVTSMMETQKTKIVCLNLYIAT